MQLNGDFCKGNAKPHFALAFSSGWMSSRGWRNGGSERVSEYRKLCHFFSLKKSRASYLCSFLYTLFAETRLKQLLFKQKTSIEMLDSSNSTRPRLVAVKLLVQLP